MPLCDTTLASMDMKLSPMPTEDTYTAGDGFTIGFTFLVVSLQGSQVSALPMDAQRASGACTGPGWCHAVCAQHGTTCAVVIRTTG